jgi:hypothetical protein
LAQRRPPTTVNYGERWYDVRERGGDNQPIFHEIDRNAKPARAACAA